MLIGPMTLQANGGAYEALQLNKSDYGDDAKDKK